LLVLVSNAQTNFSLNVLSILGISTSTQFTIPFSVCNQRFSNSTSSSVFLILGNSNSHAFTFKVSTHSQIISPVLVASSQVLSIISQPTLTQASIISQPTSLTTLPVAPPVAISATGNNDSIVKPNLLASGLDCLNASYLSQPVLIKSTVHLPKSVCKKFCNHSSVALSKPSGARVLRLDTIKSPPKSTPAHTTFNPNHIVLSNILPPVSSIALFSSLIFFCICSPP
tara:strand:- start:8536 stop:9216 length:681 start_codon:yes stop_codon:yes gene_type:complete